MKTKLTLSLDSSIIQLAKELAKQRDISLSQMISDYIEEQKKVSDKLEALHKFGNDIPEMSMVAEEGEKIKSLNLKYGLDS